MKILFAFLLLAASCNCPDVSDTNMPAVAGSYFLGLNQATCIATTVPAATDGEQHRLTLAADRKTVTETFVRNGKSYVVTYDVVSIDSLTI